MSYYDHPGNPERESKISSVRNFAHRQPISREDSAQATVAIIAQRTFENFQNGVYLGDARRYWAAATDLSPEVLGGIRSNNPILRQVHDSLMELGGLDNPENRFYPYQLFYKDDSMLRQ